MEVIQSNDYYPTHYDVLNCVFFSDQFDPLGLEMMRKVIADNPSVREYVNRLQQQNRPRKKSKVSLAEKPLSYKAESTQLPKPGELWLVQDYYSDQNGKMFYLRPNLTCDGYKPLYVYIMALTGDNCVLGRLIDNCPYYEPQMARHTLSSQERYHMVYSPARFHKSCLRQRITQVVSAPKAYSLGLQDNPDDYSPCVYASINEELSARQAYQYVINQYNFLCESSWR